MLGFDVAAIERLLAGRARIIGTFAGKACAPAPPGPDEIRMALERTQPGAMTPDELLRALAALRA